MTAARATESYWEEEGRKLGALLGNFSSLVVIGGDPTRAAEVAIGLGRVQAERRRVAIGDLLGDAPPLVALVEGDDPHGIVDSFLYGVSLNRIARQVAGTEQLYVLPTGSESPEYETILGNPRFARARI